MNTANQQPQSTRIKARIMAGPLSKRKPIKIYRKILQVNRVDYVVFEEKYPISEDFNHLFRPYHMITTLPFQPL
jgi:hypothetical protein